jgi:hypothetical protein
MYQKSRFSLSVSGSERFRFSTAYVQPKLQDKELRSMRKPTERTIRVVHGLVCLK